MDTLRSRFEQWLAAPMFLASLAYLLCLAGTLHVEAEPPFATVQAACHWGLVLLHPLFGLEFLVHRLLGSGRWKQSLWCCLCPPLRLGARDERTGTSVWLPRLGWTEADDALRSRVEKAFSLPMILFALAVLPLLAVEFLWAESISVHPSLAFLTQVAAALIWLAFTIEFVVMISIVECRLRYCREHWIDLVVICLPLAAFLRMARLGRLARLQNVTRTARVFRVRGLIMRVWRAALVLDVADRIFRGGPEARLDRLRKSVAAKEHELDLLRQELRELEQSLSKTTPPPNRKAA